MLTETLLKAQEQQQVPSITATGSQADGVESVERDEGQRSSTASSNESEPFELIEAPSAGVWLRIDTVIIVYPVSYIQCIYTVY